RPDGREERAGRVERVLCLHIPGTERPTAAGASGAGHGEGQAFGADGDAAQEPVRDPGEKPVERLGLDLVLALLAEDRLPDLQAEATGAGHLLVVPTDRVAVVVEVHRVPGQQLDLFG